ncbi:MAG TPA: response regulator transcription factor [Phnomibacter sp.]|nr:response regulator transcription factor [Phnomibacter sp.]
MLQKMATFSHQPAALPHLMPITIVICDDHAIILDSLAMLIGTMPHMEVVATCTRPQEIPTLLAAHQPQVLITDLTMPGMSGIELTLEVRKTNKQIAILMLTVEEDHTQVREGFNAGINGYVLKKANRQELEKAIRTVAGGEKFYSSQILQELLSGKTAPEDETTELPTSLTEREIDIVRMLAKEFSTNEIARLMYLSPGTVKTHRHNIMRKLQVKNSIGIIKYALKHKLL